MADIKALIAERRAALAQAPEATPTAPAITPIAALIAKRRAVLAGPAAGRARSFGDALTMGLGEKVAGAAARYGDAFGKGEGFVDTAKRVGSEVAGDYVDALKDVASDPLKAIPGMPSPITVARAVGLMAPEDRGAASEQGRDEYRAQLAADEAADPLGTKVAAGAGHVLSAFVGPGQAAAGAVKEAAAGARSLAPTVKAVGAELIKEVPGVRVAAKLSSIHEAAQAVTPAVEKLANMKRFGVPDAKRLDFLRALKAKHGTDFVDKVAKLANMSTKGL
jgi:hypothetical protein